MKKIFTLLTLLLTVVGGGKATDYVDTYGAFGTVTGGYIGSGISKIALGDNAKASSGIEATDKGLTLKFTVSTPTGFTIKSIVFKGSNTGTISCNDDGGTLSTTSGTTTLTASADKTSVEFTVESSASDKKAKLTEFIVTVSSSTTDDYELITPSGAIADGAIPFTSSLGEGKLVTAFAPYGGTSSASAGNVDFGNGKGVSITTSRAIKAIYTVWYQRAPSTDAGWTGKNSGGSTIGTYSCTTNAWTAPDDNTKFVSLVRSEGSTAKLSAIHIFYYNSAEPTVSASTVLITEDATDAGEISYTVDAKGTSGTVTASTVADWITLGAVDEVNNKVPFTATANSNSVSRSATVTLTYTYNTSETVTKDVTVTQGANVKGEDIIRVTLNGGTSATVTGAIGGTADVNVQSDKKFGNGHYAGFTLAGGNTFHTGDIINVNIATVSSGGNTTITIYDTDKETILYDTGEAGVVGDNKFVLPASCNGKTTLYICRTSSNGWNAVVNYIEVSRPVSVVSVTIGATGWSTFSNTTKALDFSPVAGLSAYMVTGASGTAITKSDAVTTVPANTGLLLNGTAGSTYYIPVVASSSTDVSANKMKPGTGAAVNYNDNSSLNYVLVNNGGTAEFQKIVDGSYSSAVIPVGKAYLALTVAPAREILDIDPVITGIEKIKNVKVGTEDNVYYDLQGRRVLYPTKGLYIVNGKKVILK